MITVLLVEDHVSFSQALGIVMAGEADFAVVDQVDRADGAGPAAARSSADVALVDLDLPGGSGVEAIADIRTRSPGTACVVLTALVDDLETGRAIEAGAVAVLHKSIDMADLLGVLRQIAGGATVLPASDTSRRLHAVAAARDRDRQTRVLGQRLTERERQILERLAHGDGDTLIAREFGIAPATARTHVRNLLGKLAVSSRLEAVVKALRLGLVRPPR